MGGIFGIAVILIMAVLVVVVFFVWCAVALVLSLGVALLIVTGVLSVSALSAVLTRRVSAGFSALYYQLFALATVPLGVLIVYYVLPPFGVHFAGSSLWEVSVLGSVVAGLLFAFVLGRVVRFVS